MLARVTAKMSGIVFLTQNVRVIYETTAYFYKIVTFPPLHCI